MPDRTINFGESETEATYQIQDTDGAAGGGNFVVAKDTNANTVLLEYQPGSDTWQYAGDVDMNGGNVSGVGTLTANSVNTNVTTISEVVSAASGGGSTAQTISSGTNAKVEFNSIDIEDPDIATIDLSNDEITIQKEGKYELSAFVLMNGSTDFGIGEIVRLRIVRNGSLEKETQNPTASGENFSVIAPTIEIKANVGDVISVEVRQDTGTSQTVRTELDTQTQFVVRRSG